MARRTTYSTTITAPIYAAWKCPKCGEVNFSDGNMVCNSEVTTSSLRTSKHEEAKNLAQETAESKWVDNALNVIFESQSHAQDVRNSLYLRNTNCTNCNAKPKWDKKMGYLSIFGISIMAAIISGIIAFILLTNIIAWLVFAASIGVFIYCIIDEIMYKKTMAKMPKQFLPVIGSMNEELVEGATKRGKTLPTPVEVVEIVNEIK